MKRAYNEVNFSKEIKSEFPRVKQKYIGFKRLGHLQLEAENWKKKKPLWSNHCQKLPKDIASALAHKENEIQSLSNGFM